MDEKETLQYKLLELKYYNECNLRKKLHKYVCHLENYIDTLVSLNKIYKNDIDVLNNKFNNQSIEH
ncbi:hypothetical protein CE11_00857 [Megavirus courdo11]|uniref:Uncharacterized protein n=1 Tax=Megavirus courdo11 TaxID=1128140 RepID=K7YWV4_9VIRU|nr:hypothetical protein CE11_00857 [Megavirus courdo11]